MAALPTAQTASLIDSLNERILMLDGGMGTMIQNAGLSEADFRGERFALFFLKIENADLHTFLGETALGLAALRLLTLAFGYRDALAAALAPALPRIAAFLRSF